MSILVIVIFFKFYFCVFHFNPKTKTTTMFFRNVSKNDDSLPSYTNPGIELNDANQQIEIL